GRASFPGPALRLTDGAFFQANSVFSSNRLDVTHFSTSFVFQIRPGTTPMANGLTFTIQGNGPTVLGFPADGLGYQRIPNSVAVKFDAVNGSTGLFTNGAFPGTPAVDLTGSGIDLGSGHPFRVDITYDG